MLAILFIYSKFVFIDSNKLTNKEKKNLCHKACIFNFHYNYHVHINNKAKGIKYVFLLTVEKIIG